MSDSSDASVPSKEGEEAGRTDVETGGEGGGGGEGEGNPVEVKMETSTPAQEEQSEREKLKAIRVGSSLLLHPLSRTIQHVT